MNYEINRQLQGDSGLSLADYHVINALSNAPDHKMQVSELAALIGWERSRLSHHLRRFSERSLTKRAQSADDGRATDAVLTKKGLNAMAEAAPGHAMLVKKLFLWAIARRAGCSLHRCAGTHPGQPQSQLVFATRTSVGHSTGLMQWSRNSVDASSAWWRACSSEPAMAQDRRSITVSDQNGRASDEARGSRVE
jgi:DNA-binding MarR family transcriptional regulator